MVSGWATGAAINVCGSIFINLGTNVMKLGHNRRAACESVTRPPIRSYRPWQLGVVLFIVGNMLNFFSFGFAAQSLLAALGSVQFVSNVFFASLVLGEKVTRRVLFATLCIVCGCVLLVSFGNHESQTLTVSDMLDFYTSPVYISFLVLLVLATGCLFFTYHYGQQKLAWMGRDAVEDKWVKLMPVTYALLSGTVGTQSVLFCKTLSTLLRTTLAGDSQLHSWFFWLTFAAFVATACFWISRLNLALQLFPAITIVPMMQISWTLFSILSGGIYFQEYKTLNAAQGCGYAIGVAVVFLGVYLLMPSSNSYLKQYNDLEAGLVGVNPHTDPSSAPLLDRTPPLANLPHIPGDPSGPAYPGADSQDNISHIGGKGTGNIKGLSGSAVERRQSISDEGELIMGFDRDSPETTTPESAPLQVLPAYLWGSSPRESAGHADPAQSPWWASESSPEGASESSQNGKGSFPRLLQRFGPRMEPHDKQWASRRTGSLESFGPPRGGAERPLLVC